MMAATPTMRDSSIQELVKKYPAAQGNKNEHSKDKVIKYEDKIRYISPQPMHSKRSATFSKRKGSVECNLGNADNSQSSPKDTKRDFIQKYRNEKVSFHDAGS